jgi:hypothetical protein
MSKSVSVTKKLAAATKPTKSASPAATKSAPTKSAPPAKAPQVIHLLVKENPKRGDSATRFAYYRGGITVEDYVARCVKAGAPSSLARADLRWDTERKFITIG